MEDKGQRRSGTPDSNSGRASMVSSNEFVPGTFEHLFQELLTTARTILPLMMTSLKMVDKTSMTDVADAEIKSDLSDLDDQVWKVDSHFISDRMMGNSACVNDAMNALGRLNHHYRVAGGDNSTGENSEKKSIFIRFIEANILESEERSASEDPELKLLDRRCDVWWLLQSQHAIFPSRAVKSALVEFNDADRKLLGEIIERECSSHQDFMGCQKNIGRYEVEYHFKNMDAYCLKALPVVLNYIYNTRCDIVRVVSELCDIFDATFLVLLPKLQATVGLSSDTQQIRECLLRIKLLWKNPSFAQIRKEIYGEDSENDNAALLRKSESTVVSSITEKINRSLVHAEKEFPVLRMMHPESVPGEMTEIHKLTKAAMLFNRQLFPHIKKIRELFFGLDNKAAVIPNTGFAFAYNKLREINLSAAGLRQQTRGRKNSDELSSIPSHIGRIAATRPNRATSSGKKADIPTGKVSQADLVETRPASNLDEQETDSSKQTRSLGRNFGRKFVNAAQKEGSMSRKSMTFLPLLNFDAANLHAAQQRLAELVETEAPVVADVVEIRSNSPSTSSSSGSGSSE